jgi:lipopolysaccharide transport system ATP-binding protein
MALDFDHLTLPPGAVIGILGEDGAGQNELLHRLETRPGARYLGPDGELDFSPAPLVLVDHTFACRDKLARERAALALDGLRRAGSTVLLVSHEEDLLARLCDEIWWLGDGRLLARGDPVEILDRWRAHVAARLRAWGETAQAPLDPRLRRGDGRAEIVLLETAGENGQPTMVWRSGEPATIRVRVRFAAAVADPVVGIMIRTRVGLNVYGTNTELERLPLGPRAAGDEIEVRFAFRCDLCPGEYTLTAASHDPDGVWHDWLEDALAFAVTDDRYTAGVANLRAAVTVA